MSGQKYMGIPREEIPWYPVINQELCVNCGACKDFCPNDVFVQGEATMRVANKYNCVVGCDKCLADCNPKALSFPTKEELVSKLKELREKHKRKESA